MDRMFDTYADLVPKMSDHFRNRIPKDPSDSDFVYRQAIRAKAFDALRGLLPSASLSNVGIYGSGQAYEALLLRMRASQLPEARAYSQLMLEELRKVIPSFLRRVDLAERGGQWSEYLAGTQRSTAELAERFLPASPVEERQPMVRLTDFDPDGEVKVVTAILFPYRTEDEETLEDLVREMPVEQRVEVLRTYAGDRLNRRHKPGRAFERTFYRFDVLSDYGAFRDLQRHRMMTIEWQALTPRHGYDVPDAVVDAGLSESYESVMARSASLYDDMVGEFPAQAGYAVALAYRIRYVMQFNAREAIHLLELRSSAQGHPTYRSVAQEMHTQLSEVAGHRAIAAVMSFVDHSNEADLERLDAERRAESRREQASHAAPE
jgi:thymidylate synthase ThyX